MAGRRLVFSDARVRELSREFIPAADEVFRLQTGSDAECVFFQGFASGGRPSEGTRQGIYAITPGGALLGSINSLDPSVVAHMLERALEKWKAVPEVERGFDPAHSLRGDGTDRWETSLPADGLVLRVTTRDMPPEWGTDSGVPEEGDRSDRWNRDFAWFRGAEARTFLPPDPTAGAEHSVPSALVDRIVRFHLVDGVRGQTWAFRPDEVEGAELHATVLDVDGTTIRLVFEGESRASAKKSHRIYASKEQPQDREWGFSATLAGYATFDLALGAFTSFEMIALGERWGSTAFNGRGNSPERSPMVVSFRLSEGSPSERVAPAFIQLYGWTEASGGGAADPEPPAGR